MNEHFRSIQNLAILYVLCTISLFSLVSTVQAETWKSSFDSALPIWPAGRETEKNLFVGFRAVFNCPERQDPVLRIAASSIYRVYLNGQFIGHGPARGPHGYYRVDEWSLGNFLSDQNIMAIEVAGYNVNSYYLLDEPAFLQAEIVSDGKIMSSTAGKGVKFEAIILKHRLQAIKPLFDPSYDYDPAYLEKSYWLCMSVLIITFLTFALAAYLSDMIDALWDLLRML